MTRRTRIVALSSFGAGLVAVALGATLGTRGLQVVITNELATPILGVELAHPGGAESFASIEPSGTVEATIRRPLAGLWGHRREVLLTLHFTHARTRSDPFLIRCELGWFGKRRVDLSIEPIRYSRSIMVEATMIGHRQVFFKNLVRNTFDPRVGPRRFYAFYWESTGAAVIRRPDWAYEARRHGGAAMFATTVWLATWPVGSPILLEYAEFLRREFDRRPAPPRPPLRLPFHDLRDVDNDVYYSLVRSPLLP